MADDFTVVADKLERQPVHDRNVILSYATRDEVVALLRQAAEQAAEQVPW